MAADGQVGVRKTIDLRILGPSDEIREGITLRELPVTATVDEVRRRVQETLQSRPEPARQRLIFRGRALLAGETTLLDVFGEASIQEQSTHTIHLVIQEGDHAQRRAPQPSSQPRTNPVPAPVPNQTPTLLPNNGPPVGLLHTQAGPPHRQMNAFSPINFQQHMAQHQHMVHQAQQQLRQQMGQQAMSGQAPTNGAGTTQTLQGDNANASIVPAQAGDGMSTALPLNNSGTPQQSRNPFMSSGPTTQMATQGPVLAGQPYVPFGGFNPTQVQFGPQATHFSITTQNVNGQPVRIQQGFGPPGMGSTPGGFPGGMAFPNPMNNLLGSGGMPFGAPGRIGTPPGGYQAPSTAPFSQQLRNIEQLLDVLERDSTAGPPLSRDVVLGIMSRTQALDREIRSEAQIAERLGLPRLDSYDRALQALHRRVERLLAAATPGPSPAAAAIDDTIPAIPTPAPDAVETANNPTPTVNEPAARAPAVGPSAAASQSSDNTSHSQQPTAEPAQTSTSTTPSMYLLNNARGQPSALLVGPSGTHISPTLPPELLSVMLGSSLPMEQITSVFGDVMREAMRPGGFLFDHQAHEAQQSRQRAMADVAADRFAARQARRMMQRAGVSSANRPISAQVPIQAQAQPDAPQYNPAVAAQPAQPMDQHRHQHIDDLIAQNRAIIARNQQVQQNGGQAAVPAQGPPALQQAQAAPPRAPDEMRDILAPIVRNLWLIIRIIAVVWFFASGGRGYGQALMLGTAIALVYAIQNGVLVVPRGWAERARGWWVGLLDPAQNPQRNAQNPAGAAVAGEANAAAAGPAGWRDRLRGVERAGALFFASLVPGLGEGYVRQVEARAAAATAAVDANPDAANQEVGEAQPAVEEGAVPASSEGTSSFSSVGTESTSAPVDSLNAQEIVYQVGASSSSAVEAADQDGLTRVNKGKGKARLDDLIDLEDEPGQSSSSHQTEIEDAEGVD